VEENKVTFTELIKSKNKQTAIHQTSLELKGLCLLCGGKKFKQIVKENSMMLRIWQNCGDEISV